MITRMLAEAVANKLDSHKEFTIVRIEPHGLDIDIVFEGHRVRLSLDNLVICIEHQPPDNTDWWQTVMAYELADPLVDPEKIITGVVRLFERELGYLQPVI